MADLSEIYAYTALNDAGNEGLAVVAFEDGGVIPLVAQTRADAERLRPLVGMFEKATGKTATLVRFSGRETVTE